MPWVTVPTLYWAGFAIGAVVLIVGIVVIVRKSLTVAVLSNTDRVAVSMLLFVGMTSLLAAVGRYRLDLLPAHRYGIYAIVAFVSLFFLALPRLESMWRRARVRKILLWGTCVLAIALLTQQVLTGRFAVDRAVYFAELERRIMAGDRDGVTTYVIFPAQDLLDEYYELMEKRKIYMYSE